TVASPLVATHAGPATVIVGRGPIGAMPMALTVRPITQQDVPAAGRICHDAFRAIATEHNFPPDFPNTDISTGLVAQLLQHPKCYGVVAEQDGHVVGSNFIDERSSVIGLGPITVDPAVQNSGVGTALMTHMIGRAAANKAAGLRLLQSAYHR